MCEIPQSLLNGRVVSVGGHGGSRIGDQPMCRVIARAKGTLVGVYLSDSDKVSPTAQVSSHDGTYLMESM